LLIGNLLQSQEVTPSSHHSIMRWLLESAPALPWQNLKKLNDRRVKVAMRLGFAQGSDARLITRT
jgi:hypothetical protein